MVRQRLAEGLVALAVALTLATACGGSEAGGGYFDPDAGDGAAGFGGSGATGGMGGSAGADGGCQADDECPGQVCDGASGQCVDCVETSDCEAGESCVGHRCEAPTTCSNSLDCVGNAERTICDAATGECVECLAARDCLENNDCVDRACKPYTPCVNSLDCPTGLVCDTFAGRCVECVADADCGADGRCAGNICRTGCESDITCTSMGLLCDKLLGYCVECVRHTDCASAEHCAASTCQNDVCAEGSSACQGNAQVACNSVGSGYDAPQSCGFQQSCVESGGTASCQSWICSPSVIRCEAGSERVMECSADGLKETALEDCGQAGEVCVAGACAAVVCTAGQRFCQNGDVRQCSTKGDSSVLYASCSSAQYCDPVNATCKTKVCDPGQATCNGSVATTCNGLGSGYVAGGVDCASSGQVCSQGNCRTQICTPSTRFCDAGVVKQCSGDGLSATTYQTCSFSQYCDAATASCKAQVCSPNQSVCNGNVATTCNADGSGYQPGGTDCSSTGQVCSQGACADQVCTPSQQFCDSGNVRLCAADGLSSSLYDTCTSSEYCDAATATCEAQVCTPDQPACEGSVATTCNADGSAYLAGGTDCTPRYCAAGACVDALFKEDFEDGNYDGWTSEGTRYTRAVTTISAANGTAHSLYQYKNANTVTGHADGLSHAFNGVKPSEISWWSRVTQTGKAAAYFNLYPSSSTGTYLIWHYFDDAGLIRLTQPGGAAAAVEVPYTINQWYHFELRNIDWTAGTYDYYVDGALKKAGAQFSTSSSGGIYRLDLYNFDFPSYGYWDEIEFR